MPVCPVCGAQNPSFIEKYSRWDCYGCPVCDTQFWWPLRHPGRQFYEDAYDPTSDPTSDSLSWGSREFLAHPVSPRGTLLDIGCAYGDFMHRAEQQGFAVWGVDISARSVEAAKIRFGLRNCRTGTIGEFAREAGRPDFDVATAFEVIEHVDDPAAFVEGVAAVLKKGGYFVFSTPDRECLGGWHDTPPQHLMKWNEKSLRFLLASKGFEVVGVRREPVSAKYFIYRIFGSASPLSLGIVSRIKSRIVSRSAGAAAGGDKDLISAKPAYLSAAESLARAKAVVLKLCMAPLVLIGRFLGWHWQAIYVVARKK